MDEKKYIAETSEHIKKVGALLAWFIGELEARAARHDEAKLESPEKEGFMKYTPALENSVYGSEEYRDFLKGLNVALIHHYKEGRHHPEHFSNGIRGMTLVDIVEMICDWRAATLRHKTGDVAKSIEFNQNRFGFSDDLREIFLNTARMLE